LTSHLSFSRAASRADHFDYRIAHTRPSKRCAQYRKIVRYTLIQINQCECNSRQWLIVRQDAEVCRTSFMHYRPDAISSSCGISQRIEARVNNTRAGVALTPPNNAQTTARHLILNVASPASLASPLHVIIRFPGRDEKA
jgi:hypothetical protein